MQHHHDVRAQPKRLLVTGLVVGAVPEVPRVDEGGESETPGHVNRAILARVVDQEDIIDNVTTLFEAIVGDPAPRGSPHR